MKLFNWRLCWDVYRGKRDSSSLSLKEKWEQFNFMFLVLIAMWVLYKLMPMLMVWRHSKVDEFFLLFAYIILMVITVILLVAWVALLIISKYESEEEEND